MQAPIRQYHQVDDRIATGAQPSPQDFAWLRDQGFSAVVNLNIPSARNYLRDEASLVRAQGMEYVPFPVDCSKLTPEIYDAFRERMKASGSGRVFVHCAANVKSTALMHAYRVRELGHDRQASLQETRRLTDLEPKWFDWFQALGV